MSSVRGVLREIVDAWRALPWMVYEEHGFVWAAAATLLSPVIVPIAAVFYFSIPARHRDTLDEWEELAADE